MFAYYNVLLFSPSFRLPPWEHQWPPYHHTQWCQCYSTSQQHLTQSSFPSFQLAHSSFSSQDTTLFRFFSSYTLSISFDASFSPQLQTLDFFKTCPMSSSFYICDIAIPLTLIIMYILMMPTFITLAQILSWAQWYLYLPT